jgi:hypothetical protein
MCSLVAFWVFEDPGVLHRPHKDHYKLSVSCFVYKCLENKNGEEESTIAKAKRQERQITHRSLSLSQVTNH